MWSAVILRPLGSWCGCQSEPVHKWVMAAPPVCLFVHLPISLSTQSFILLFIIYLSTCLFICPSLIHLCMSTHLSVQSSTYLCVHLSFPYFYFPSHSTKDLQWMAETHTIYIYKTKTSKCTHRGLGRCRKPRRREWEYGNKTQNMLKGHNWLLL